MHQERRGDEVLTLSLPVGAKVLSWKVLVGSRVKKGSSLCTYSTCTDVKTLVSPLIGIIDTIHVKEGDTVSSSDASVISVRYCDHSVVALDLCAFCGLDLRSISSMSDRGTEDHADVSMLHGMPQVKVNKKEAQRLGNLDKECLLKNRKLALIIDLDQTLIHTSIDRNIERGLPDVHSFTLPGHSCIYHCRLRPYVREFLNHISQYYELHVATMGTRDYADAITKILDQEKRLFSHRVISRNELLDPHSKAVRLKSVFPCGDEMVAIMDDRGDVWGHRPNLIHVKAYVFFAGTDDINAPPSTAPPTHSPPPPTAPPTHSPPTAPPTHPPTVPPTHPPPTAPPTQPPPPPTAPPTQPPPTAPPTSTVPPQREDHHSNVSSLPSNSNSNNNTDKGGNGNGNKDGKNNQTEGATGNTTSTTSTPPLSLPSTSTTTTAASTATASTTPPPSGAAASGSSGEARGQANSGKDDTSSSLPSSSTTNEDRVIHTTGIVHDVSANNETVSGSDDTISDTMVVSTTDGPSSSSIPPGDESHHLADYNVSSSSSSSSSSDSSDDDEEEEEESMDTTPSSLAQNQPQPAPEASPPDTPMEIHAKPRPVINDPDKFLVYLQDLLERIHETFYKEYDEMKREEEKERGGRGGGSESLSSPDLKVIIPSLRKSVFSGLRLLFTGIIPTNMNPEKSREWNTTRAFGGEIHSTLITSPAPDDEHTTHVIAGKKDTDKYKQALRIPRIEIVGPEWFWDCAERWKRLDEDEYRLDGERKVRLKQETSQTKLKDDKKINDVRRRKGRREEEGDSKGKRKMTPPRQKAKLRHEMTTPPFERKFSVSSAELELMEAEIDAELETDDDEDDDDERIGSYIQPVKDEDGDSFNAYLGLEEPSQSRGSSRKRKRVPDNDPCSSDSVSDSTSDDSTDDELSALLEFT